MSSHHHAPAPRTRPGANVRPGRPIPSVPIPIPEESQESRHPKKARGKNHSAVSDQSHDTRRRPHSPSRRHNFQYIGAWSDDVPVRHYTTPFDIDVETRGARNLPAAPMPPSPPRSPRLDPPHPSILAYDAEFLDEALEHMARTGLHPPRV
ncbi:uncharacterized protein DNG_05163 [Cephalotrichum gorgonifer]|uniref:Uncharacterized protein n=1 Tax=Cephalotrichum gorgonifer TaxID=2041049 RepID=A0AAE8SV86_9PEZI|nr:uncharacterized protein DNG_05163 [Cephalotrichum gorgonifer]